MFTEILKITPKIDGKDLGQMETTLNGRFKNIAKKFGSGLVSALKGGAVVGVALALIDKVLNPLKEVQEAIEKTLHKGDDLSTYAKQFNTTAGNLARLQAFGKASGLDPEGVRMLLLKFQTSVANSAAHPGEVTAVSNFVGQKDSAEAFFNFVQALQKLTPIQQSLVEQEVFGERQILKASEFLHQDFKPLAKFFDKGPSSALLTQSAEKLGALNDLKDATDARRELIDLPKKAGLIGPRTIKELAQGDDLALNKENNRLAHFDQLKQSQLAIDRLTDVIEQKALPLISGLLQDIIAGQGLIATTRALRGVMSGPAAKEK